MAEGLGPVDELRALRRVATLVAEGVPPKQLFAVVADEVARVLDVPIATVLRYESDGTATSCARSEKGPPLALGTRFALDGPSVLGRIRTTGKAARIDDYSMLNGELPDAVRVGGIRSSVGAPIVVSGGLWGAMVASNSHAEPLPEGMEERLADFTELLATAIANAESREAVRVLAEEQAALRRVATLVAQGASPPDLFGAVAEEIGRLLSVGTATMGRFESDDSVTIVAAWSATEVAFPVGERWRIEGTNIAVEGARDGPARSSRRLPCCHRPDRRRRAGGRLQVSGWKPDRRQRAYLGFGDGYFVRRTVAARHRGAPRFVHRARRNRDPRTRKADPSSPRRATGS